MRRVNQNTSAIRASIECDIPALRELAVKILTDAVASHETYEEAGASLGILGQAVRRLLGMAGVTQRPGGRPLSGPPKAPKGPKALPRPGQATKTLPGGGPKAPKAGVLATPAGQGRATGTRAKKTSRK